jgi:hypothetical protein
MSYIGNAQSFRVEGNVPGNLTISGNATVSGTSLTVDGNEALVVDKTNQPIEVSSSAGDGSIKIDSSGRVLKPNAPAFQVFNGANQGLGTSGATIIMDYDNVLFDTESGFDTSTNRYTVPVAGTWYFEAHQHLQTNLTTFSYLFMDFTVNGSRLGAEQMVPRAGGGTFSGISGSNIIPLNANDYVSVSCVQSGGSSVTARGAYRRFRGFLIG